MKMFQMSVVLVLLASYAVRSELSKGIRCLRTYQELERSLLARDNNLDSMRDAFYPPNRQESVAVTVYYFFDYGKLYNEQNLNLLSYRYAFRWSASPVLEFIRPELLQYLSMFIYHGHATTINIVVDPLCEEVPLQQREIDEVTCSGERNSSDPALMLNTLTVHLKSYILDNRLLGVDEENRGFSSYLYNHNNEKDHCVIGQQDEFKRLRIYVAIVLNLLPILLGLVIPSLIVIHYETVQERMTKIGSNQPFYLWAIIIASVIFYCFTMCLAMSIIVSGLQENTNVADVRWYYVLGLFVITTLPILNGVTTIAAAVSYNMIPVMLSKNLLPSDISPSLNSDKTQAIHLCCKIRFIAPTVGITSIVFTIQVMWPYSFYIILGLIVSPIHTCSFLLFYTTGTASLVVFIAILLKAYYTKCKTFTLFLIGSSILVLVLVLTSALMEMTILFGDHDNNGGVLSIIGSFAPSLVLSGLGFVGNWALSWLKKEPTNNIPVSSLTITDTWGNTANWPRRRIIIRTQRATLV